MVYHFLGKEPETVGDVQGSGFIVKKFSYARRLARPDCTIAATGCNILDGRPAKDS
jgi:hypothetical protein